MRKLLLNLHLFTALVAGIFIAILGVSGSVLVFRPELERAFLPQVTAKSSGDRLPIGKLVAAARAAHPESTVRAVTLPMSGTRDAAQIMIASKRGNSRLYFDPVSGAELGSRSEHGDWLMWLVDLHHNLFTGGHFWTGIVGAAFSVMCITGVIVWWPRPGTWRWNPASHPFRTARFGAREAHIVFGLWCSLLLLAIAFTSTVFTWREAYTAFAAWISNAPQPTKVTVPGDARMANLDLALAAAQSALPEAQVTTIRLPVRSGEPIAVRMKLPSDWRKVGSNQVFVGENAEVLKVDRVSDAALPLRAVEGFAPVHFGEFAGLSVRILWSLLGFVPSLLFVSGMRIWWRSRAVRRPGTPIRTAPSAVAARALVEERMSL